ncbi:MAG: DUF1223 domain-containing protein [Proteobacteria bacterium]|nr:DUF1223 domain-containing protein [Pseudomonadota bacterium]
MPAYGNDEHVQVALRLAWLRASVGGSARPWAVSGVSQGCSRPGRLCELTRRADVLPLAFHVTYWNDLGWRDRFSFPEADARQTARGRSVYTPQDINGAHSAPQK